MIPHMIVLEPGLVVYKIYNGYWFFGRPTLEELRQDLARGHKKMPARLGHHHAWLRAAWQQGKKERFYPYGKTYAQPSASRTKAKVQLLWCEAPRPGQAFPPEKRLLIQTSHITPTVLLP